MQWQQLGLSNTLITNIYRKRWLTPTVVQQRVIPWLMQGKSLCFKASPGSGKTGAYLLPLIEKVYQQHAGRGVRALVLVPSRDLAVQIVRELQNMTDHLPLRIQLLVGSSRRQRQTQLIRHSCNILVATPGRLHYLLQCGDLTLPQLRHIVLDEADCLLSGVHKQQVTHIMMNVPQATQIIACSATLPATAWRWLSQHFSDLSTIISLTSKTRQAPHIVITEKSRKLTQVLALVRQYHDQKTLIFTRNRRHLELLNCFLRLQGYPIATLHGGLSNRERARQLALFTVHDTRLLVATDVAARGLEFPQLQRIINYDLPVSETIAMQRAGRGAQVDSALPLAQLVTQCEWQRVEQIYH